MLKLQSAMEYLMTYGWAILVIGIVLSAMFEIGLVNPGTFTNPECVMPAGFICINWQYATNGLLTINLEQATQSTINVTGIACSTNVTIPTITYIIPSLQTQMPIGSNAIFNLQCFNNGVVDTLPASSLFTGTLAINYTETLTGFPHVASGKVIARVV